MSKQRMKDCPDGPGAVPARNWTGTCQDPPALRLLIRGPGPGELQRPHPCVLYAFSTLALFSSREHGLGNNGPRLFSAEEFTKYSRVYLQFHISCHT